MPSRRLVLLAVAVMLPGAAAGQVLPLPPGAVVTGPVFRADGSFVPRVATGADANAYIFSVPPTASFVAVAPAAVVYTSVPTQYVRVYTQGITAPNRAFIASSDTIRGMTPAQVRDVLALPYLPDSITLVAIPAGTCVMTGTAAPIATSFAASPPAIPTPGPWGNGGVAQGYIVGRSARLDCASPGFLPPEPYFNRQPIGANALAYAPRAGGGNPGAVAAALDRAAPTPPFTDMASVYDALDRLNFGDPGPLGAALAQLGGEVYASRATMTFAASTQVLDTLRTRMHQPLPAGAGPQVWASGFGGIGAASGTSGSHDVSLAGGGFAAGAEQQLAEGPRLSASVAYARGGFSTKGLSGSGTQNLGAITVHARHDAGPAYLEGIAGAAFHEEAMSRQIAFPGIVRSASGSGSGWAFLSRIELGYRAALSADWALTPFAAMTGLVSNQGALTETGAGAASLAVNGGSTGSALGVLGGDVTWQAGPATRVTARAGWAHEFAGTGRTSTAWLTGTPGAAFTISGAQAARNAAVFGLDVSFAAGGLALYLRYDGAAGGGTSAHGGSAGLRAGF